MEGPARCAALSVTLPLGEYHKEKILNLGQNRFVFRPQVGMVHTRGPWSFELTGSVFLYTANDSFRTDRTREQDPVYALQSHVVYASPKRWWVSVGSAYGSGGESRIDGISSDDTGRDWLYGVSTGLALSRQFSVKIGYVGSRTRDDIGADLDNLTLAFTMRF